MRVVHLITPERLVLIVEEHVDKLVDTIRCGHVLLVIEPQPLLLLEVGVDLVVLVEGVEDMMVLMLLDLVVLLDLLAAQMQVQVVREVQEELVEIGVRQDQQVLLEQLEQMETIQVDRQVLQVLVEELLVFILLIMETLIGLQLELVLVE
jgi:hypothetical protein